MTPKLILMMYLGLLIGFSNGSDTIYAKYDENGTASNIVEARTDNGDPFEFFKNGSDSIETALCPVDLPIFCSLNKIRLCVEHDKTVFHSLNNNDATQTIKFLSRDGTALFNNNDQYQYTCGLARKKTNLTPEEFSQKIGILHQFIMNTFVQLEDIEGDPIAICKVSCSDQVQYFQYDEDDAACKYMAEFTIKKFHINNTLYSLSCRTKTDKHTAKQVFEELEKDRQKESTKKVDHTETGSKKSKKGSSKLQTDDKWYENDKYQLGLILLCCIIVVTLSLCCCTSNNGDPDNEDPNNHYPASSDLVLEVLDTVSSLSTASSTDSLPPSTGSTTDSTVRENTLSKSVEPEEITEHETRSAKLTKVIRTQPNSVEEKENTESQKESADLKENIQPQSNSVELKEDTQSQTKSLVLEDAQSQSDALEKENTQSETDSLFN